MGHHLHTSGEEFQQRETFRADTITKPTSIDFGLHLDDPNEGGDDLADGDTDPANDVTTEPGGSSYARQSATLDGGDFSAANNASGNWEVTATDQTFDTGDSSQNVDSYFVVVNFDGSGDQLFWSGALDQLYDLSNVDEFVLQNAGLELD
jgi:hypothetical protein